MPAPCSFSLRRRYKQLIADLLSSINNRNMWVKLSHHRSPFPRAASLILLFVFKALEV